MAKVIFITGGSRGIGLAIGRKFAKEGNKVYFTYLKSKKSYFNKFAYFQSKNVIPIKCDMSQYKQIKSPQPAVMGKLFGTIPMARFLSPYK